MIIQKSLIASCILKPLIIFYNYIKDRFNQTDHQIFAHLQEILVKAFKEQDWKDDFQIVIQNYGVNELMFPH